MLSSCVRDVSGVFLVDSLSDSPTECEETLLCEAVWTSWVLVAVAVICPVLVLAELDVVMAVDCPMLLGVSRAVDCPMVLVPKGVLGALSVMRPPTVESTVCDCCCVCCCVWSATGAVVGGAVVIERILTDLVTVGVRVCGRSSV